MMFLQSGRDIPMDWDFSFLLPGKPLTPLHQGLQALWNRQTYGSILNKMAMLSGDDIYD